MTGEPNEFSDQSQAGESSPPDAPLGGEVEHARPLKESQPSGETADPAPPAPATPAVSAAPGAPAAPDAPAPAAPISATPATPANPTAAPISGAATVPATPDTSGGGAKIQIGSRRDGGPQGAMPQVARPVDPTAAASAPAPPKPSGPVPPPSKRDPLSAELEAELADALGNSSLEDMLAGAGGGAALEVDARVSGTIVKVHGDDVFLSLGGQHEGIASTRQFQAPPEPGLQVEVIVKGLSRDDGLYEVAVPGSTVEVSDWDDLTVGEVVEARVTGSNTGGLECKVNNLRGFIPASQISLYRVENLNDYIDRKLPCVVTEANPKRKNLVLSHRAVLEREREAERAKVIAEIAPGQIREGVVRNLRDFGAFVDLGGVDGLIHVSQLSWERVEHPKEVLTEGQKVQVRVEKVNAQTGKISLSYRSLQEHPWTGVEEKFTSGSVVDGTVSRIANFGAFVKLAPGIEGLVHVSELAHHRVSLVSAIVREGDEVKVKVLSVDPEAQRIALSIKQTTEAPVRAQGKGKPEDAVVEDREPVLPKHDGPLKGGVDHPSGGDQFGLHW